ncbi:MAG: hypothetical protein U0271_17655 [Polyangiaceae bacterium]
MRTLYFSPLFAITLLTACGDSGSGGGGNGGQNAGGAAAGGAGGSAGGAGGAGCHGDSVAWAAITAEPIACTKNSDCCVVVNGCLSSVQVVHADDFATAGDLWPFCDTECNDCIAPVVNVGCVNGECVGDIDTMSSDDSVDHCGVDAGPLVPINPNVAFGCGG